jgi:hypothetical protein
MDILGNLCSLCSDPAGWAHPAEGDIFARDPEEIFFKTPEHRDC